MLIPYILADPDYYNIDQDSIASTYAILGGYSSWITFMLTLATGALLDTMGRKIPLMIGFIL